MVTAQGKGCGLPIFDDAEVKTGQVPGDEGLKHTDDPPSVELTVGVSHLTTHTHSARYRRGEQSGGGVFVCLYSAGFLLCTGCGELSSCCQMWTFLY